MSVTRSLMAALTAAFLAHAAVRADPDPQSGSDFPTAPLDESVLDLPADPDRPATLQVTVLVPWGPGPFPVAVMNHGAPKAGDSPSQEPRYRASFEAFYFLSRGYAVVLPMQRGYAGSNGQTDLFRCDIDRFAAQNARDILQVIGEVATDSRLDTSRVVVAGYDMGGWNALAVGAAGSPAVKGVLNFSGGIRVSNCADQEGALTEAAERLGRQVKVPSLWFYSDNDKLLPPSVWREMHDRYTRAGGDARLVDVGTVGVDGHLFTASGASLKLWTPAADAFLNRLSLPSAAAYPQYLPSPPPPPSHFSAIDDVMAVPYLDDAARAHYRNFLAAPLPRALVLSPQGFEQRSNGFDPLVNAMSACTARFTGCAPYAVDNEVVWVPPKDSPRQIRPEAGSPETRALQATVAAGTTATLNFAYAVNPDCTTRGRLKIWITRAPGHGTAKVALLDDYPVFPPSSAFAKCNAAKVPGVSVTYTPDRGCTGEDTLTYEAITLRNQDRGVTFTITVK